MLAPEPRARFAETKRGAFGSSGGAEQQVHRRQILVRGNVFSHYTFSNGEVQLAVRQRLAERHDAVLALAVEAARAVQPKRLAVGH